MPSPDFTIENASKESNDEMEATVGSIKNRLNKAKKEGGSTLGQRAELKQLSEKENINTNGETNTSNESRDNLPERPRPDEDQAVESVEKDQSDYEKLGDISKLIDIGDPVIPDDVSSELDAEGSWFFADLSEEDDDKLHIIYKAPNGDVVGDEMVDWETITPRYKSAPEFQVALKRLRERYEEARDNDNEAYQKHLAQLILQVRHFAKIFHNRHQNKAESS